MSDRTLSQFFDRLTGDYTAAIERCVPRYREMLWALLDYLPATVPYHRILELGCGTGNLSLLLSRKFPQAEITCVDLSAESLDECRDRLQQAQDLSRFRFMTADMRELDFESSQFDLVVSSISIHHLTADEKQALFAKACNWLRPEGVFSFADQFRGTTDEIYARHMQHWREQALAAGSTGNVLNLAHKI